MFGFGNKKTPADLTAKFLKLANEAHAGLAGLLENERLVFRDFQLELSNPEARSTLASDIRALFTRRSRNPDNWPSDVAYLKDGIATTDKYRVAAFAILAALVKTNLCCKVALEYSDDEKVKGIALQLVSENFNALEQIFSQGGPSALDSTPAFEAYSELMYVKRFMDRCTGVDRL